MWGIKLSPTLRPFAWVSSVLGTAIGLGTRRAPQTSPDPYVLTDPFEDNTLTSDEDMWNYMKRQTQEIAGVGLGGPSLLWLREALIETRALQNLGAAVTPAHTFLGTNERIVATEPIHSIMAGWTNGQLSIVDGAEHEVVMERPHIRRDFWAKTDELFSHV
jgi:lysophospholipase